MLFGIRPIHGRPYHPQTQGKVERFHRTAKEELGPRLFQPDIESARRVFHPFVHQYNWIRPHDSLGGKVPGSRYLKFPKQRPDKLPEHHIPEGAISRSVYETGRFNYKGDSYRIGKGLAGQRIIIAEAELGPRIYFAGFPIVYLSELEASDPHRI